MGGGIFFSLMGTVPPATAVDPLPHAAQFGVPRCWASQPARDLLGPRGARPHSTAYSGGMVLPGRICRSSEDAAVNNYKVVIVLFTLVDVKVGCESSCPFIQGDGGERKGRSEDAMSSRRFVTSANSLCDSESFSSLWICIKVRF